MVRSNFHVLVAPVFIMGVSWLLAFFVFLFASAGADTWTYFRFLALAEGLGDKSTPFSYVLLFISFFFFGVGALAINACFIPPRQPTTPAIRTIKPIVVMFIFTLAIAGAWVGGAIVQVGGVGQLANIAASDNNIARKLLLEVSFPGGRLIASGFIGLAVLSAAYAVHVNNAKDKTLLLIILFVALTYLGLAPILVSGRINFFVACIGAYVAASLSARRSIGMKYVLLAVPLLIIVWVAKQYFSLGHIEAAQGISAFAQSTQALVFYVYNDLLNALNATQLVGLVHTYGWYSLRFVFFFTFTDRIFLNEIGNELVVVGGFMSAGEIPLLSAPYVDFGIFGLILIFAMGAFCQYAYKKAHYRIQYAALYGLIAPTLLMSTHNCFITSQEIVYSMILVGICSRYCLVRNRSGVRGRYGLSLGGS